MVLLVVVVEVAWREPSVVFGLLLLVSPSGVSLFPGSDGVAAVACFLFLFVRVESHDLPLYPRSFSLSTFLCSSMLLPRLWALRASEASERGMFIGWCVLVGDYPQIWLVP